MHETNIRIDFESTELFVTFVFRKMIQSSLIVLVIVSETKRGLSDLIGDRLGRRYETIDEPDCYQWPIYEWDEDETGHGIWLISDRCKWSVEYQIEGVGAFILDYPSEAGIMEWIELKTK